MKVKVLFVCYGNICRSPIAEYVFRKLVDEEGLSDRIVTASCATSAEHIGDPIDPRSGRILRMHGIDSSAHRGRRLKTSDYSEYDYIIGMDRMNLDYIQRLNPWVENIVVGRILDYAMGGDVADPWYTGNF